MAQGTIKVTNGSVDVVGTGTAFTSMKPGSFLTFVLVGVAYTVAIDSVQSATALKLSVKFDGPTTSGVAFDESPVGSMALATMGVTVQAQKALRMMIADQTNWREVFSTKQTITVTLPDGTQFTGYSWGYISEQLKTLSLPAMQAIRDETVAARNQAQTYATNASNSATSAGTANTAAQSAKTAAETARNQAQTYQQQAAASATTASNAATTSTTQAGIATTQAGLAKQYADSVNPANLAQLNQANTFSQRQTFDGSATVSSNWSIPFTLTGNSPTIRFTEIDKPSGSPDYSFVVDGGNWRIQREDSGASIFSYTQSGSSPTLRSGVDHQFAGYIATGSYAEAGQVRTTGSYSQDGVLIRAISNGSCYTAYADNSAEKVIRWRAGLATSGGYAIYYYNADGSYNSTPVAVGGDGTGIVFNGGPFSTTGRVTCGGGTAGTDALMARSNGAASYVCNLASNGVVRTRTGFSETVGNYGFQTYTAQGSAQYWISLPNGAGQLAIQGTSGLDYKRDINPADSKEALDRIMAQNLVTFIYKDDEQGRVRFGIIAEESEKVTPQYIKHHAEIYENEYDENGEIINQKVRDKPSVDTNPIVMDLIGAIHNLQGQLNDLRGGND